MRILLIDEDKVTLDLTAFALKREGHRVVVAVAGDQAIEHLRSAPPDLILLAADMTSIDGFDLCVQIRKLTAAPIVVLSGRNSDSDVVRGFECGADDYIMKPFSVRQLLVRMASIMRRIQQVKTPIFQDMTKRLSSGDLEIDPTAYIATKNDAPVHLTRLEFRLLYRLVEQAGSFVDTDDLVRFAWRSDGRDASLLKTHISHLRRKLAQAGGEPVLIRAVPHAGYVFSGAAPAALKNGRSTRNPPAADRDHTTNLHPQSNGRTAIAAEAVQRGWSA